MKFIRNLLIIFVCFSCISLSLRAFYSYHQSKLFYASIKNEKGGKFLVGSSLGTRSINDSILKDWQNFCVFGANFTSTFIRLHASMPFINKVDTIVIVLGSHQVEYEFSYNDASIRERTKFDENNFFMNCDVDTWSKIILKSPYLFNMLFYNSIYSLLHPNVFRISGGFYTHRIKYLDKDIKIKESMDLRPAKYTYDYMDKNLTTQIFFIRKTINLCLKNNKVCVLINFPIYQCDRWFNKMTYLDFLDTIEGKEKILIADYEDYELPDSCYMDVVHLNKYGSDILCNDIKENGLRLERLPDFVAARRVAWRKNE